MELWKLDFVGGYGHFLLDLFLLMSVRDRDFRLAAYPQHGYHKVITLALEVY